MNVITYIGTAAAREVIRTYEFGQSPKKLKMNVLLTTYEITLRDVKELGEIKWQMLMVDEVRVCVLIARVRYANRTFLGPSSQEFGESTL